MKYRAIVKRPDEEYGHVTHISTSLNNLQKTVGGYIEAVTIKTDFNTGNLSEFVVICNEEGKIQGLEHNCWIEGHDFVGTIIFMSVEDENFSDCLIDFKNWKIFMDLQKKWGWFKE